MGDGVTTRDETKPMPRAPEAGQIVRVRQRQYFKEGREETDKPRSAGTLLNDLGHPLLTGPGTVVVIVGPASLYTETRGLFPSSDYPRNHHGLTGILEQRADRGQADRTASGR